MPTWFSWGLAKVTMFDHVDVVYGWPRGHTYDEFPIPNDLVKNFAYRVEVRSA